MNNQISSEEYRQALAVIKAYELQSDYSMDCPPNLVGVLTKRWGIKGYIPAEKGHPVYESNERYIIYLKHANGSMLTVPFYKETIQMSIIFTSICQ